MKIFFSLILFIIIPSVYASAKNIGVGAGIGSVTIISGEYVQNERTTYDGGLSFSLGDSRKLYLHGSRLFRFPNSWTSPWILNWQIIPESGCIRLSPVMPIVG